MALLTESRTAVSSEIAANLPEVNPALDKFAETVALLGISPQDFNGNILIVGHGPQFLERKLVCTQESGFHSLRRQVNSLTLVDINFPSDPRDHLQEVVINKHPQYLPGIFTGAVNYYQWSLKPAMSGVEEPVFDTIAFFRVEKMQPQFPEVLEIIDRTLKPGGLFVGSGGFKDESAIKDLVNGQFSLEKTVVLPNPDHFGRGYNSDHIGFVMRKHSL